MLVAYAILFRTIRGTRDRFAISDKAICVKQKQRRSVLPKFNIIELSIVALGAVALGAGVAFQVRLNTTLPAASMPYHFETDETVYSLLEKRYGPSRYSEDLEEWIIRDAFKDKTGGVFVDVGANHYRDRSNTYYLESKLDWSGVAVEP